MDINSGTKSKRYHIWGWISAIIGGLFMLFGLLIQMVMIYDTQPDWYPHLLLSIPSFLIGITLLILGIRRIKNVGKNEEQNIGTIAQQNTKRQRWGLIFAIVGLVITLFGISILLDSVLPGHTTEWYLGVICSVPTLLIGIFLTILGTRRIKNVPETEQINWGWAAAIGGGLMTLYSLSYFLLAMFTNIATLFVSLECGGPGILFGIPLLIFGIRKIIKVRARENTNPENNEVKKRKQRVWGVILVITGGLIILCGLGFLLFVYYLFFILSPLRGYVGPYEGYLGESFILELVTIVIPVTVIGVTLVIPGSLMLKNNGLSRQSRGWIFLLMGGVYLFTSLLSIGYNVTILNQQMVIIAFYLPLFLILGVLGFIYGIRDIKSREKINSAIIGSAEIQNKEEGDEPQVD
jgi:hypothetical protein